MMALAELTASCLLEKGFYSSPSMLKKNPSAPFKDHPQFTVLTDILSRQHRHHAILKPNFPANMYSAFLEALLLFFNNENIPSLLVNAELFYLNLNTASLMHPAIDTHLQQLNQHIAQANNTVLIALNADNHSLEANHLMLNQVALWSAQPNVRLLVLNPHTELFAYQNDFACLELDAPTETDILALLKQQRSELEAYHHIVIPEELLIQAYALAGRYLSTHNTLEKTLILLDSSAARTSAAEPINPANQFKPVLTLTTLLQVLSSWTRIPITHLQLNKFKLPEFTQNMLQHIFGQDAAIHLLAQTLQRSQANLQQHPGPFCSFLFTGPAHTGKKTTALALTQQLFNQVNPLYFLHPLALNANSVNDIRLQRYTDKRFFNLTEVIQQTPYAVLFFENIEQASPYLLDRFFEIVTTGYLHDDNGAQHDFHQAILLFSTTLGSECLADLAQEIHSDHEQQEINLMQLVLNEAKPAAFHPTHEFSPQELTNEILPIINEVLPSAFCQYLHIVPFLPLNKMAIEKIVRLKIKMLSKMLDIKYGVELSYAPEVIRYLVNDVVKKQGKQGHLLDLDKSLKQLYFVVEQSIMSQADNKTRPHQLFLQLNETGQILKCEWSMMTDIRHHAQ